MDDSLKAQLFRRHLMFFILKQVLFIVISIAVFTAGIFLFASIAAEFFDSLTNKHGVDGCVESMVNFFVGLFLVLIIGIVIIFTLALVASMLASFLVNYLITEMDIAQREKTFGQKLGHSIIPPLAGIGAMMLSSAVLFPFASAGIGPYMGIGQFLLIYIPVNYYFDKKFYMEGLVVNE